MFFCLKYTNIRETFLPRFETLILSFFELSDTEKMSYLLR